MIGPGAGVRGPNPTPLISEVRVYEDGVKPIKPEAKCIWARGGCAGAKTRRPDELNIVKTCSGGCS